MRQFSFLTLQCFGWICSLNFYFLSNECLKRNIWCSSPSCSTCMEWIKINIAKHMLFLRKAHSTFLFWWIMPNMFYWMCIINYYNLGGLAFCYRVCYIHARVLYMGHSLVSSQGAWRSHHLHPALSVWATRLKSPKHHRTSTKSLKPVEVWLILAPFCLYFLQTIRCWVQ